MKVWGSERRWVALRLVAAAAATLGALVLLVADSAGPRCATYQGLQIELDWTSDCFGDPMRRGHVSFATAAAKDDTSGARDIAAQAADGGLRLASARIEFQLQGCTDSDGSHGVATPIALDLAIDRGPAFAGAAICEPARLDAGDQTLRCASGAPDGGTSCTLGLHRTAP